MHIFIIVAMTGDGCIGHNASHLATTWTTPEDKALFVRVTKEAGTMVMGENTFLTFGKPLPGRRLIVYTENPEKITAMGAEPTSESPAALVSRLKKEGVNSLAICGGSQIYTMFMQSGLVQEVMIDMQATFFGSGLPLFKAPVRVEAELTGVERLGPKNVLLQYSVRPA